MEEYEKKVIGMVMDQAKVRRMEIEGLVYPMEQDLKILEQYHAISWECWQECLEILNNH